MVYRPKYLKKAKKERENRRLHEDARAHNQPEKMPKLDEIYPRELPELKLNIGGEEFGRIAVKEIKRHNKKLGHIDLKL